MEFNNKENEKIEISETALFISKILSKISKFLGIKAIIRIIWLSRAVAVVGTVCLIKDGIPYFLIGQRGKGAADFQGLWNLPCGYLDWNETSGQAFIREVWEECGINVKILFEDKNIVKLNLIDSPWDVNSNPTENRQNVCLHHGFVGVVDELPTPEIKNIVEKDEVSDVKWVTISDIENYEFAFQHKERIQKFIARHCLDLIENTK